MRKEKQLNEQKKDKLWTLNICYKNKIKIGRIENAINNFLNKFVKYCKVYWKIV